MHTSHDGRFGGTQCRRLHCAPVPLRQPLAPREPSPSRVDEWRAGLCVEASRCGRRWPWMSVDDVTGPMDWEHKGVGPNGRAGPLDRRGGPQYSGERLAQREAG